MKREILFRGLSNQGKGWLYGDVVRNVEGAVAIMPPYQMNMDNTCSQNEVNPETIGQYTGLKDKNGKKIFEGDIISIGDPNIKYIIMWRNDGFCAKQIGASSYIGLTYWASNIEVLGNVIDNPELIK
jgi:hypothetical protein